MSGDLSRAQRAALAAIRATIRERGHARVSIIVTRLIAQDEEFAAILLRDAEFAHRFLAAIEAPTRASGDCGPAS